MGPALRSEGLTKSYGARRALAGLDLAVESGTIYALLGPNASGKSTFLRIAAGLVRADAGRVALEDSAPGVAFQSPALDPLLTARENLLLHARLRGLSFADAEVRVRDLAARLGLETHLDARAKALSGGTARRVEIARALLHTPRMLLLDEPEAGLDPSARAGLAAILRNLRGEGVTILVVTHHLETAAAADRVGLMNEGRLVVEGDPDELALAAGAAPPRDREIRLRWALERVFFERTGRTFYE